jgi:hypothetical protein
MRLVHSALAVTSLVYALPSVGATGCSIIESEPLIFSEQGGDWGGLQCPETLPLVQLSARIEATADSSFVVAQELRWVPGASVSDGATEYTYPAAPPPLATFTVEGFIAQGTGGEAQITMTCCSIDQVQPCDTASNSGCDGDPHFKTWRGQHYDYHGECDLVLLHSAAFGLGLGLDIHIRTRIRRDMSYISSAALRIDQDLLEVESQGVYYFNGVKGAALPAEFSGFEFLHTQPTDRQHVFEVYLGGRERIKVKTYKDFVSVLIEQGEYKHFGDSAGLMGDFRRGHMIARDGITVIKDANAFGQEWQVLDTEPSFFHTVRLPQHPQQECMLPPPMQASQLRRRLSEPSIDQLAAKKACAHWGEGKDDCVFDVLATADLTMAEEGEY